MFSPSSLSLCVSVCVCLPVCLSACLSVCQSLSLSVNSLTKLCPSGRQICSIIHNLGQADVGDLSKLCKVIVVYGEGDGADRDPIGKLHLSTCTGQANRQCNTGNLFVLAYKQLLHMHVCMYSKCMCTYIFKHMHTDAHTDTDTYPHIHTHTHSLIHTHKHTHTHTHS